MHSLNARLVLTGFLTLVLLVPSSFVGALIAEREARRQAATGEVGAKWGARQTVAGPILHVPYKQHTRDDKGNVRTTVELATFLPAELQVRGSVTTEVRRRGIYDVVLYRAGLSLAGRFDAPRLDEREVAAADALWDRAFVAVGMSDTRGIDGPVTLAWNGARLDVEPGVAGSTAVGTGIHARVPGGAVAGAFTLELPLRGHDGLHVVPVAARNTVMLRSPWPHPSFAGAYLPRAHAVAADGFTAEWSVLDLNRGFPQQWLGAGPPLDAHAFGVELLQPVDGYQKSDRAHKYALLLIALTFVTFFFIEMLRDERVHALNYVLCGLAICLFYVLLLSLSEHVGFDAAYAIATLATTALVTWHARNVFARRSLCRAVGGTLALLYGALFALIQLKDYALLFGSLGLFAILAAVMWLSSRVTWAR